MIRNVSLDHFQQNEIENGLLNEIHMNEWKAKEIRDLLGRR